MLPNKKLTIVFSTTRQWNPGDEFILHGVQCIFNQLNISYVPIIYNRNPDLRSAHNSVFRKIPLVDYHETNEINHLQAELKIGMNDNSIKPDADLSYVDLVVFAGTPEWCNNERVDDLYRLIIKYQIPTIYLGIGEPFTCKHSYYQDVINQAKLIITRQKSLFHTLVKTRIYPERSLAYLPCPSLLSVEPGQEKTIETVDCIGLIYQASKNQINIMSGVSQTLYENELRLFHQIIQQYQKEKEILIICHYVDEVPLALREFPDMEVCYSYDAVDYYEIYKRCDVVVGSRVHGIGVSASLSIPGLALVYDLRGDTCEGFEADVISGEEDFSLEACMQQLQKILLTVSERNTHLKALRKRVLNNYVNCVSRALEDAIGIKVPYPILQLEAPRIGIKEIIADTDLRYCLEKYHANNQFVQGRIYIDNGTGFSDECTLSVPLEPDHTTVDYATILPAGVGRIRFDPVEGMRCKVTGLQIVCGDQELTLQSTNGLCHAGQYYFVTDDPQFEILLPSELAVKIQIRAKIFPLTIAIMDALAMQMQEDMAHFETELEDSKHNVLEQNQMIATQAAQLSEAEDEITCQVSRISELELSEATLREALTATEAQISTAEEQISHQISRISELELSEAAHQARAERYLKSLDCQNDRSKELFERCQDLERLMDGYERQSHELQACLDDLRIHYDDMHRSISFRLGRVLTWFPRKVKRLVSQKFVMRGYYEDLNNRINCYEARFSGSPRSTAIRMIWWNLKSLLKRQVEAVKTGPKAGPQDPPLDENRLNIGFIFGGGFGDNLIAANYLHYFRKKYSCPEMWIDVFFAAGYNLARSIFEPGVNCDRLLPELENVSYRYDLFIWVNRYPRIYTSNLSRIQQFQPELQEYVLCCNQFYRENALLFDEAPYHDGETAKICISQGKTRIQQADIGNMLGIETTFHLPMFIHQDESAYLESIGLKGKTFITLHRGSDTQYSNRVVKLWPLESYNTLIQMLKKDYPDCVLVQVGISEERCPAMKGIDLSLVGKTSMEDMKVLLLHAATHIDGEGGFIHLRQTLHAGPSVVLFGPTELPFYGYTDNYNIRGDGCDSPCEWKTPNWLDCCMKGFDPPVCMASIKPEQVMEVIRHILQ